MTEHNVPTIQPEQQREKAGRGNVAKRCARQVPAAVLSGYWNSIAAADGATQQVGRNILLMVAVGLMADVVGSRDNNNNIQMHEPAPTYPRWSW